MCGFDSLRAHAGMEQRRLAGLITRKSVGSIPMPATDRTNESRLIFTDETGLTPGETGQHPVDQRQIVTMTL